MAIRSHPIRSPAVQHAAHRAPAGKPAGDKPAAAQPAADAASPKANAYPPSPSDLPPLVAPTPLFKGWPVSTTVENGAMQTAAGIDLNNPKVAKLADEETAKRIYAAPHQELQSFTDAKEVTRNVFLGGYNGKDSIDPNAAGGFFINGPERYADGTPKIYMPAEDDVNNPKGFEIKPPDVSWDAVGSAIDKMKRVWKPRQ
jgi:hypothetical protein